ncbi:hypothetical protein LshimejAT787_0904760 [Lyophyllum shimeji]|uniref:EXPERA domain-containing protein n=1 Tax=Lyophyllum shimeji TaxID=47721 RepID=A0A9P3USJ6_LYOSH|nr:hypothetical protein LshimejAT787_0904760 [Lyophyllum shimeji]
MAVKTHRWISFWFLLTVPVIAWDVGYCFMRPRSMRGGDLHWLWKPYSIYQDIDYVYGLPALQSNNGFTSAQALLNVIETLLNITYLYFAHVAAWPPASLIGFASASMTLSKTILYWAQEYYCGFCGIGHNTASDLVVYWIIPNGLWIVVPALVLVRLGKDLAQSINFASRASANAKLIAKRE